MSTQRQSPARWPRVTLGAAAIVLGIITVPITILLLLIASPHPFAIAPLIGYPLAVAVWILLPRARTHLQAWSVTLLVIALLVAVSAWPVLSIAIGLHEEWLETQPGGRGYRP